ncbi:transducin-like enhancer protein 6 [Sorex fumeus]|uniref:transducin-like enhancer protein 6 n=1 Tax=Sorex fumeus TaxID=62283 RepID=UPI0024ADC1F4|nr:transducin-like enhancer protein 6 [Sorex fumeus]
MESMLKKLVREVDSYILEAQGFLQILNAHSQYITIQTGQSRQAPITPSPTKRTCLGDTASKEVWVGTPFPGSRSWDSEDNDEEWGRTHSLSSQSTKVRVPQKLEKIWKLKHGTPVLATALSSFTRHAFTCGSDGVKVWSLASQTVENPVPETHLHIQTQGSMVHTCHLTSDSTTLLMAGNSVAGVSVWDLKAPTLHMKSKLPSSGFACQALASSLENNLALGSLSNGIIRIWDLRSGQVVRYSPDPATKIVVMDQQVWAGSQEGSLQCWDLQNLTEPQKYQFDSQITALSPHPQEDFVLVGLSSGQQWLQPTSGGLRQMVGCKEDTILDLTFSPKGQWWVSVGMDNLLSIYHMPAGTPGLQVARSSSIVCCDVAQNDRLLITGSRNHCTLYQIQY